MQQNFIRGTMRTKLHLIFDFNHMFYKYKFRLEKGTLKTLSYGGKNISYIYYNLRDIESARKKYIKQGYDVFVHICMDSKTKRKDEDAGYKANREKKLSEDNFSDIEITANLLKEAGYDVTKVEGYEADDLIWTLCNMLPDTDKAVIYTNDSDVTINVTDKISVELYNSVKGTQLVTKENFNEFMGAKFKSYEFKYNEVMLYKALVGDVADNIPGIYGFGERSFDKFMASMRIYVEGFEHCFKQRNYVEAVIKKANNLGILNTEQMLQAIHSLDLVEPRTVDCMELKYSTSDTESRTKAYSIYEMKSLY